MTEWGATSPSVSRWLHPWWPDLPSALVSDPACAVLGWAAGGGMAVTGCVPGCPDIVPAAAFGALEDSLRALSWLTGLTGSAVDLDAGVVIGGRAATRGLRSAGRVSAGGMTRLLRAADEWFAISLCRPDDVASVPALIGDRGTDDPWFDVTEFARSTTAAAVVEQAQLLGIAAATLGDPIGGAAPAAPFEVTEIASSTSSLSIADMTVVDLSSLWAGPLCGHVLRQAGARVIKVESTGRPDGARIGDPALFDWLHRGQEFRDIDFTSSAGRDALAELITDADVVIEASRPRALESLGLSPDQLVHRPGRIWVSITGGGRSRPMQVDFGDDAAVGGGLVGWRDDGPVFCADAVADPLSGITAALAVTAAAHAGGGVLVDLSMTNTAAAFAASELRCPGVHLVRQADGGAIVDCTHEKRSQPVLPPAAPPC
ncbi:CoA transferase [Gordonia insulae]|uniref:Acetyl-CoA:oxalate CoA-transferase n=1 Tax=Gordonia insulae TaxID=2420509 RepID=A0A3G8JS32_9ACTN|nr:CoA transferase [Gordonia insulae]AZG47733.1 Acetyl-CoA:oxalate CoA-transferase [Gordonia insulae]